MKRPGTLILLFLFIGINTFSQVRIACSSNIYFALEEWVRENSLEDQVHVIPGATMNLFHQIENGAPFHLFICADPDISKRIESRNQGQEMSSILNKGYLVLWSREKIVPKELIGYGSADTRVALSDPRTTPFGQMGEVEIETLGINGTRVYGDGIIQVNQFIRSEGVDLALTSNSILKIRENLGGHVLEMKEKSIENRVHLLIENEDSKRVFERLNNEQSKTIWKEFFFLVL